MKGEASMTVVIAISPSRRVGMQTTEIISKFIMLLLQMKSTEKHCFENDASSLDG